MKKSIIILPLTMLLFVSCFSAKAEVADTSAQELSAKYIDSFKVKGSGDKQYYIATEVAIFDPGIYFTSNYATPVEQRIASDNQIIDSNVNNEDLLVFKAKTIEQIIAADIQITDATIPEVAPIHIVEVIAPSVICTKAPKSKM